MDDTEELVEMRAQIASLQIMLRSLYVFLADAKVLPRDDLIAALRQHEESQRRQNAHAGQIEAIRTLRQALSGDPPVGD